MAEAGETSVSSERGPEESRDSFLDIQMALQFEDLDPEGRRRLEEQRARMVGSAAKAGLFRDAAVSLSALLKGLEWDEVYGALLIQADNLERSARRFYSHNHKWEGMVRTIVEGAAAKTAFGGILKKAREEGIPEGWLEERYVDRETVESLKRDAKENYLYPVVGPTPELLVGTNLRPKEEPIREQEKGEADVLREIFGRQSTWEERKRWAYQEYTQDFYTRFDPGREPRFYTEITSNEERALWDIRWQLARAAFIKKATSSLPEKYRENSELERLLASNIEKLYNMPGVRSMLEGYARHITSPNSDKRTESNRGIELKGGLLTRRIKTKQSKLDFELSEEELAELKYMRFWDITSMEEFEIFREALRGQQLEGDELFQIEIERIKQENSKSLEVDDIKKLLALEADAVAWNLLYVTNQVESSNSFYSHAGKRSYELPGAIFSADFSGAMHQNERWFWKIYMGQGWGVFTKWGIEQMKRVKKKFKENDEPRYVPASSSREFWKLEKTNGRPSDLKRARNEGRVIKIYVPECHPVIACGSFWEETKVEVNDKKKPLLDYLETSRPIPWDKVLEDQMTIWLWSKFNKAVQLQEYFNPGKPPEIGKPGWGRAWADPLIEILETRLGLGKNLEELRKNGVETHQNEEKIRKWAVFAATGGVRNIRKRRPTLNLSAYDRHILVGVLSDKNVGFLRGWAKNLRL